MIKIAFGRIIMHPSNKNKTVMRWETLMKGLWKFILIHHPALITLCCIKLPLAPINRVTCFRLHIFSHCFLRITSLPLPLIYLCLSFSSSTITPLSKPTSLFALFFPPHISLTPPFLCHPPLPLTHPFCFGSLGMRFSSRVWGRPSYYSLSLPQCF